MKYTTNTAKVYSIKSSKEINRGGEGKIMLVENNPDIVAKIFHKPKNIDFEKRVKYLEKLDSEIYVIPENLLFSKSKLVGYTMQYLNDDYYPISTFFSKNFCQKNNINSNFKKQIIEKLRYAVENAHRHNIVIGDLNQFNILINMKGKLKIIDTDSFETPENNHSCVLLDEIRDYLYNGAVNQKSDYFAFSVIVFYLLTFVHPFKGIHKKFKSLKDRMINRISVVENNQDLKTPNFYFPISDNALKEQFKKIFISGERFLVSINSLNITAIVTKNTVKPSKISNKDIIVKHILENLKITNVFFNDNLGYVETDTLYMIYSSKNRGYLSKNFELMKKDYDSIFIGDENILLKKDNKLYNYKNEQNIIEIKNFEFSENVRFEQKGNIIVVFENDIMFWLFIDEIFNNSIKNQRFEVFAKSFNLKNGLIQNIGQTKRVFYNSGNVISSVKIDKNIKSVNQNKNIGIVQYVENDKLVNDIFVIKENNIILAGNNIDEISEYCYLQNSKTDGLIIYPTEKKIKMIRTEDFALISEIKCDIINQQTVLNYTKSGIIAFDENDLYLINSKINS